MKFGFPCSFDGHSNRNLNLKLKLSYTTRICLHMCPIHSLLVRFAKSEGQCAFLRVRLLTADLASLVGVCQTMHCFLAVIIFPQTPDLRTARNYLASVIGSFTETCQTQCSVRIYHRHFCLKKFGLPGSNSPHFA